MLAPMGFSVLASMPTSHVRGCEFWVRCGTMVVYTRQRGRANTPVTHTHMHMQTLIHVHANTDSHVRTHTYTQIHVQAQTYIQMQHTKNTKYVNKKIQIYRLTHTRNTTKKKKINKHTKKQKHTHTNTHTHTHTHTHTSPRVDTYFAPETGPERGPTGAVPAVETPLKRDRKSTPL